jgi:integrase
MLRLVRKDYALSPVEKNDARAALAILAGSGITLARAAELAMAGRRAGRRVSIDTAVQEFLRAKLGAVRSLTYGFYEYKLGPLVSSLGTRPMDEVTRAEFRAWLAALGAKPITQAGYVRACRALWRWALAQEPAMAAEDVTGGIGAPNAVAPSGAQILTVAEAEAVMRGALPQHRAALALMMFAGVRTTEVRGRGKEPMRWGNVRLDERMIRVEGAASKTGRTRILEELPEAVWAWIGEAGRPNDALCDCYSIEVATSAGERVGRRWPRNAMRHTFASYALALTGDPGKVAMWLGHEGNPTMLHRHYRGLATKAEAVAFFGLRP